MIHTARPGDGQSIDEPTHELDQLDWIEVPLETASDRPSARFAHRRHGLAQLSVSDSRPGGHRRAIAELLRKVAQRLDELGDDAVVYDITFGRAGGPATGPADESANAHMTVYYEG
jgi:hypothetical protein